MVKVTLNFQILPRILNILADSKHSFPYGNPIENYDFKKMQILLHPDEWSNNGYQTKDNFNSLAEEHLDQFKLTLKTETKIYNKICCENPNYEISIIWK